MFDAFDLLRCGTGNVEDECDLNETRCRSLVAFDSVFDRVVFDNFIFMIFACCDDAFIYLILHNFFVIVVGIFILFILRNF